jgi:DNA invertase Pin-like site-specific DNA recombinase
MKFAIWAAVSTPEQAKKEKTSIEDQVQSARSFALRHGGVESCGPYILDGYSRTGYEGLAEAAADIPQLQQLLEDMSANKFDVLVMDNFDRLGDIAQMLRVRFKKHKKQLVSARQSGSIIPVGIYDPYKDESTDINMHVEGIIQTYRINKMRRAWNAGVPARIDRGLHPLSTTYGYKTVSKDAPAAQVPEQVALILQMKDWFLEGKSYEEIGRRAEKILPPLRAKKWHRNVVKRILLNPYYAGIVRFGAYRQRIRAPRSEWKVGQGKHEPLWDEETYRKIQEMARRKTNDKVNYAARYPFTGLLVCGICGGKISRHGKSPFVYLSCEGRKHWAMRYDKAVDYLSEALVMQLKEYQATPPSSFVDIAPMQEQFDNLQTMRKRVQAGYESGLYTAQEASVKLNAIEEEAEVLLRKIENQKEENQSRSNAHEQIEALREAVDLLPDTIKTGDPETLNNLLTALIKNITLQGNTVRFEWRE